MPAASTKKNSAGRSSKKRLGRGLSSLISKPVQIDVPDGDDGHDLDSASTNPRVSTPADDGSADSSRPRVVMLTLDQIKPNPRQPRQNFDEASLAALAQSIQSAGLMQPIVVRPGADSGYELIAGERRWRAAGQIGLESIPAIVQEIDDQTAAEWSLVENIQREDLNAIERAEALLDLAERFGLTHQEIADRVGLDRSSVSNLIRINELDADSKSAILAGVLSLGHAKALLSVVDLKQRHALMQQAVRGDWSVRELERQVRKQLEGPQSTEKSDSAGSDKPSLSPHLADLQQQLSEHLGTKVEIKTGRNKGTGKLTISFYTIEQFEGITERLGFSPK